MSIIVLLSGVRCWPNREARRAQLGVSFGEIFGSGEENPLTSDFALAISNKLAKADARKAFTSGSYRPILLKNSFWGGEEKFLASLTSFNNFYTRGYIKNLNSRYRSSHRLLCRD
jgi:hypothetical protein